MAIRLPIYMDNHATTPVDPRVMEAMLPYFTEIYGNAASVHVFGWKAQEAVEKAREQVAALIGAKSGKATLDTCKRLQKMGCEITWLDVDPEGRVDPAAVAKALTDKTVLVSIMLANNEVGTVQPVREIGRICRERGVLFHCDAAQGAGKVLFDVNDDFVDLVSLSGHKLYGPKGVGALYVRHDKPRVKLSPILDGGGHERGMRSGTLNVPGIVGFGKAAELSKAELLSEAKRVGALRDRLEKGIFSKLDRVYLNGCREHRLPGNLNVSFAYVEGEGLMLSLKDVAVSTGSACTSASLEPSHVLRAMGVGDDLAHTSIRFGLGRFNTEEEVDYVIDLVVKKVQKLREMSPLYEMAKEGIDPNKVQWAAGH